MLVDNTLFAACASVTPVFRVSRLVRAFHRACAAAELLNPPSCRVCPGVNVTGEISTNGTAGNVTYQWVIQPGQQAPQPLNQSVVAGQDAVDVTVVVQGSGHGSASRQVTLQVLGPELRTTSTSVVLRC